MKSEPFSISNGVRQGCVLAPTLFNIFIDYVVRQFCKLARGGVRIAYHLNGQLRISRMRDTYEEMLQILLYADDMVLLAESEAEIKGMVELMDTITSEWGLKISVAKTKILSTADGELANKVEI